MSNEQNKQALRPTEGGMLTLNVMNEAERLKMKPEWSSRDRLAVSLVKDDALNILLMVLKKGARLEEHRTKGPIALHVLAGAVRFMAGTRSVELSPGSIVALDRGTVHALDALGESIVLLITSIE